MTTLGRFWTTSVMHASFEPEEVPLGGPAGILPPEVPQDQDHRHPAIDGSSDPITDLPQHRVGRVLTRDRVKAIAPLELLRREPIRVRPGSRLTRLVVGIWQDILSYPSIPEWIPSGIPSSSHGCPFPKLC